MLNLHAEKNLSYYTPGNVNSSEYFRSTFIAKPINQRDSYSTGDMISIQLSNIGQSDFMVPSSARLEFTAVLDSTVATPKPESGTPQAVPFGGSDRNTAKFAGLFPGALHCFSSVEFRLASGLADTTIAGVNIPQVNNHLYVSRLLCGDDGVMPDAIIEPWNFSGCGDSAMAGLSTSKMRGMAASGKFLTNFAGVCLNPVTTYNSSQPVSFTNMPVSVTYGIDGNSAIKTIASTGLQLSVPLSAISHLFNNSNCYVPMGYLSQGNSNATLNLRVGAVSDACFTLGSATNTLKIIDPRIVYDTVSVCNRGLLTRLKELYTGSAIDKIPLSPTQSIDIRVPMCLTQRAYRYSSLTVPPNQSHFQFPISCSLPCVEGLMLKILPITETPSSVKHNMFYLKSDERTQVDNLSIVVSKNSLPKNTKFTDMNTMLASGIYTSSVSGEYYSEFQKARHLFGLFADNEASGSKGHMASWLKTGAPIGTTFANLQDTDGAQDDGKDVLETFYGSNNTLAFSLETIPLTPGFTEADDSVLRGQNLSAVTSIVVEGDVRMWANPTELPAVSPSGYQIHALLAYHRAYYLLAGSPIETAIGDIVSGGL